MKNGGRKSRPISGIPIKAPSLQNTTRRGKMFFAPSSKFPDDDRFYIGLLRKRFTRLE
jgi:hypothetical protein